MPSYNHVTLIGRLGHDPDVKIAGEQPVAKFSLATDRPARGDTPAEPDAESEAPEVHEDDRPY